MGHHGGVLAKGALWWVFVCLFYLPALYCEGACRAAIDRSRAQSVWWYLLDSGAARPSGVRPLDADVWRGEKLLPDLYADGVGMGSTLSSARFRTDEGSCTPKGALSASARAHGQHTSIISCLARAYIHTRKRSSSLLFTPPRPVPPPTLTRAPGSPLLSFPSAPFLQVRPSARAVSHADCPFFFYDEVPDRLCRA